MRRLVDTVVSLTALVVLSPVMAVLTIAILAEDGLPVLFKQERIGKDGTPFTILKYRTMVTGLPPDPPDKPLSEEDPRITSVGRILRSTSLDELPQLVNVVKGEMSIVGPRPTIAEQVERYEAWQRKRLAVRPGITGWAQVNGRNAISWDERIEMDVWYVENRNLFLDMSIVGRTISTLLSGKDVFGATGEER